MNRARLSCRQTYGTAQPPVMRGAFDCKEWKQQQYLEHLKVRQLAVLTFQAAKAAAVQIDAFMQARECVHNHTAAFF